MRFLAGHYLALSGPPREGCVGLVQRDVSLCKVAQAAALEAASICSHALGSCPGVRMVVDDSGDRLRAAVPEYLHYIVLELLKNAMRAIMQVHGTSQIESDEETKMSERQEGSRTSYFDENEVGEDDEEDYEDEEEGDDVGVRGTTGIEFADVPDVVISVRADGLDDVLVIVSDHGWGIAEENTEKVSGQREQPVKPWVLDRANYDRGGQPLATRLSLAPARLSGRSSKVLPSRARKTAPRTANRSAFPRPGTQVLHPKPSPHPPRFPALPACQTCLSCHCLFASNRRHDMSFNPSSTESGLLVFP